ncbi:uncharacterized protein LOC112507695 [Cynara cardunculus var. scolymus]|uniref:uncharacterized protein LOC112507695 n=1 Tax=Cynara cardunculus var. scolymus TaxID=59895 RepID=UPI000D62B428|nr:uncharacterized protein LOC112507695 [Cynara cardunculus var. scolymus]
MALSVSDLPAMYTLLSNSLSGDEALRKPAESTLAQSENLPGFSSCLMEVITAKDLVSQTDVRLMASLYFKNSINRYRRNKRDSPQRECSYGSRLLWHEVGKATNQVYVIVLQTQSTQLETTMHMLWLILM